MPKQNIAQRQSTRPIGDSHPKARLTNRDVELMRQMHDEGWGYRRLALKFESPIGTVKGICRYRVR